MNIYDVLPQDLINAVAMQLKTDNSLQVPEEAKFWKTSWIREFPPEDYKMFWYIRGASLLRKLYRSSIGINRLKKVYGGRTPGYVHLKHSSTGSGAIIRRILQQLETAGLVQKTDKKGRILTNAGRSLLDKTAATLQRAESTKTA